MMRFGRLEIGDGSELILWIVVVWMGTDSAIPIGHNRVGDDDSMIRAGNINHRLLIPFFILYYNHYVNPFSFSCCCCCCCCCGGGGGGGGPGCNQFLSIVTKLKGRETEGNCWCCLNFAPGLKNWLLLLDFFCLIWLYSIFIGAIDIEIPESMISHLFQSRRFFFVFICCCCYCIWWDCSVASCPHRWRQKKDFLMILFWVPFDWVGTMMLRGVDRNYTAFRRPDWSIVNADLSGRWWWWWW